MGINETIFKELIKQGYSKRNGARVWDLSDSKLWFLTPELVAGFLALEKFEPYKKNVIEPEIYLLKKYASSVLQKKSKNAFNIVDLGCGNGMKAEIFIKNLPSNVRTRYCAVDNSPIFLEQATSRIKSLKSKKVTNVQKFMSSFDEIDDVIAMLRNNEYSQNICLLLGSTLSNFEINDLLYKISKALFSGDCLVIGNGVRKGRRFVQLKKYKSPFFNNWFIHLVKGLGFSESEVEYDARFANGRVEGFYRILVEKDVDFNGKKVKFKKDDEILVATQYKYYLRELKKFCEMYFRNVELIKSQDEEYVLIICEK